jgi:hypothetical protein
MPTDSLPKTSPVRIHMAPGISQLNPRSTTSTSVPAATAAASASLSNQLIDGSSLPLSHSMLQGGFQNSIMHLAGVDFLLDDANLQHAAEAGARESRSIEGGLGDTSVLLNTHDWMMQEAETRRDRERIRNASWRSSVGRAGALNDLARLDVGPSISESDLEVYHESEVQLHVPYEFSTGSSAPTTGAAIVVSRSLKGGIRSGNNGSPRK